MLSRLKPLRRLGGLGRLGRLGRLRRSDRAAAPLGLAAGSSFVVPHAASAMAAAQLDEFLSVARQSFVQLQAAWDRADLGALCSLATEPLYEELREQLAERGPGPNCTEVLTVDARLLAMEELGEAYVASVEFSGVIREHLGAAATPFRELWLLANLKAADRGWQLARVQSLS